MEIQHNHRHDRPQLDHHIEHLHELVAEPRLQYIPYEDQMPRAADWEPLCDSLHNSQYNYLQYV